jgi:hypothetical protein
VRPEELLAAILQRLSGGMPMPMPVQGVRPAMPVRPGAAAAAQTPFPRVPMQVALLRQLSRPMQMGGQGPRAYTRAGGVGAPPTSFPQYL